MSTGVSFSLEQDSQKSGGAMLPHSEKWPQLHRVILVSVQRTAQTSFRTFLQTRIIVDGAKFSSHDSGSHF